MWNLDIFVTKGRMESFRTLRQLFSQKKSFSIKVMKIENEKEPIHTLLVNDRSLHVCPKCACTRIKFTRSGGGWVHRRYKLGHTPVTIVLV